MQENNRDSLDELIEYINLELEKDPNQLESFWLDNYLPDEVDYIVNRLQLDDTSREKYRNLQLKLVQRQVQSNQKLEQALLREQGLRDKYNEFSKQAVDLNLSPDHSKIWDTIVTSMNQWIHDPTFSPKVEEINLGLNIFFSDTCPSSEEINDVIDKLELKDQETFREAIKKQQLELELERTARRIEREREVARREAINKQAEQFITDPSRSIAGIAEFLNGFYSKLPYQLDEIDLQKDLNEAIEAFEIHANDINALVDLLDLNSEIQEEIKKTQQKRIDSMRGTRWRYLTKEIEEIRRHNPDAMIQSIISVIREQINHPIIPLTRDEIDSLLGSHFVNISTDSRSLQRNNLDSIPLTMHDITEIMRELGLQTTVRYEAAMQLDNMTAYAERNFPQFPPTDVVLGNSQEFLNLASHKREFKELVIDSVRKMETKGELAIQPKLANLNPEQLEELKVKLNKFKEQRQNNRIHIDGDQIVELEKRVKNSKSIERI